MIEESRKKILYVDDELVNLMLFEALMKPHFEVITYNDPVSALKSFEEPDVAVEVVISDMMMPEMNGVDFVKEVRKLHPTLDYYILTGYTFDEKIEESIVNGEILKCYTKPFDRDELLRDINGGS